MVQWYSFNLIRLVGNLWYIECYLYVGRPLKYYNNYLPPLLFSGARFGLMQSKIGLIQIIKNFRVSVSPKTKLPLTINGKLTLITTKETLYLKVHNIWKRIMYCNILVVLDLLLIEINIKVFFSHLISLDLFIYDSFSSFKRP